MAGALHLDLVTPTGPILSMAVDEVQASGVLGEFGVLPQHIPFITGLMPGRFRLRLEATWHDLDLADGYAEVGPDKVIVLCEKCERGAAVAIVALLDWGAEFTAEQLRGAVSRGEGRMREIEKEHGDHEDGYRADEEYRELDELTRRGRERLAGGS